jgi:hypothetical protein
MGESQDEERKCPQRTMRESPSVAAPLPIMAAVLIAFLIIGLALPVLPLHVHQGLGLSTFVVVLVAGSQFAASLISVTTPTRGALSARSSPAC